MQTIRDQPPGTGSALATPHKTPVPRQRIAHPQPLSANTTTFIPILSMKSTTSNLTSTCLPSLIRRAVGWLLQHPYKQMLSPGADTNRPLTARAASAYKERVKAFNQTNRSAKGLSPTPRTSSRLTVAWSAASAVTGSHSRSAVSGTRARLDVWYDLLGSAWGRIYVRFSALPGQQPTAHGPVVFVGVAGLAAGGGLSGPNAILSWGCVGCHIRSVMGEARWSKFRSDPES